MILAASSLLGIKKQRITHAARRTLRDVVSVLNNKKIFVLLIITLGTFMAHNLYFVYFPVYLDDLGFKGGNIGFLLALAGLSEIPVLLGFSKFIKRLDFRGTVGLGLAVYAFRYLLMGISARWAVLFFVQMLHGFSYMLCYVGIVSLVNREAAGSTGISAVGQSAFWLVAQGLGTFLGVLFGGILFDTWGLKGLYLVLSLVCLAMLAVLLLFVDRRTEQFRT
jgi:PPP family 3-phenylpropionic acid transporter